tara:strand:- start:1273 stop:2364 length:1092 start_codon:yes stop_codon:yes gene_type:complete
MKKKEIIFYLPNIIDDGIKKTLEIYTDYLAAHFKISLITNTTNMNLLKKISKKVNIINPKIPTLSNIKFLNICICVFLIFLKKDKNSIIFSLDDHFLLLFFKSLGFKFKHVIRTSNPFYNPKNFAEKKYKNSKGFTSINETKYFKFSDLAITFSKYNKDYLKKNLNVKNVEVVYNYISKFNGFKKKKKSYNIFFIGRFVDSKNPIFFLKNLIKLRLKSKINFKIYIIGKGELKKQILSLKRENNFIFVKNFVKNPFKKFNKKIDIFCLTSKYDGTPNTLAEAISYKIPCIAPRNVGLSNLLLKNGKAGHLYRSEDAIDFQNKVENAITNYKRSINYSIVAYRGLNLFDKKNTLERLKLLLNKI